MIVFLIKVLSDESRVFTIALPIFFDVFDLVFHEEIQLFLYAKKKK